MDSQQVEHAPAHPAPPPERPISGRAVLSFVLALVSIVVGLATGLWWVALVPFGLALYALATVSPLLRRGRILAFLGLVLSLLVGSCTYMANESLRSVAKRGAGAILAALSSEAAADEQLRAAKPWIYKTAFDAGIFDTLRTRFEKVVAEFGPYENGSVDLASRFLGAIALTKPPEGVREIGAAPDAGLPALGKNFWVVTRFGKSEVHVALELMGGNVSLAESMPGNSGGRPSDGMPWISDVRFFVAREAATPDAD